MVLVIKQMSQNGLNHSPPCYLVVLSNTTFDPIADKSFFNILYKTLVNSHVNLLLQVQI
jgi:hypothetical protein